MVVALRCRWQAKGAWIAVLPQLVAITMLGTPNRSFPVAPLTNKGEQMGAGGGGGGGGGEFSNAEIRTTIM